MEFSERCRKNYHIGGCCGLCFRTVICVRPSTQAGQTGFAFYVLGSFLTPVLIIGLGALNLVGSLSFDSGNGFCICAIASALFMVTGFVGRKIYKSKTYQGILYFDLLGL